MQDTTGAQGASQNNGERVFSAIPTRRGEELRIAFSKFKGQTFIAIRVWYADNDGEMKPSNKGVNIKVEHLPEIANGIAQALEAAKADGLLT